MKCEHCGNAMKWVGSMIGGQLECEHCMNDDEQREYMEAQMGATRRYIENEKATGNPLTCGKGCSMNGGPDYCQCYGEPSLFKEQATIAPRPKCSYCGWSLGACKCDSDDLKMPSIQDDPRFIIEPVKIKSANPDFPFWEMYYQIEVKGEFKC